MKVHISEVGELIIEPENGTEAYALKRWAESYFDTTSVCIKPTIKIGSLTGGIYAKSPDCKTS